MKYRIFTVALALIVGVLYVQGVAWAQTGASLSGIVTDQSGATLSDVAVSIKNLDSGAKRMATTDGAGHYQVSGLSQGRFEVRAAKPGFAEETRSGISLASGQDATVDFKMQMGASESTEAAKHKSDACTGLQQFATTDCSLTWHGITVYGAYDVGLGWVSHGLPENAYNYEGESLVNRNARGSRFVIAPNNLQQTGFGIRGREEFAHDWFAVFNASTGINPQ